jgi:hypothetical protein
MQHIVVRTANPKGLQAGDWVTNAVGRTGMLSYIQKVQSLSIPRFSLIQKFNNGSYCSQDSKMARMALIRMSCCDTCFLESSTVSQNMELKVNIFGN